MLENRAVRNKAQVPTAGGSLLPLAAQSRSSCKHLSRSCVGQHGVKHDQWSESKAEVLLVHLPSAGHMRREGGIWPCLKTECICDAEGHRGQWV